MYTQFLWVKWNNTYIHRNYNINDNNDKNTVSLKKNIATVYRATGGCSTPRSYLSVTPPPCCTEQPNVFYTGWRCSNRVGTFIDMLFITHNWISRVIFSNLGECKLFLNYNCYCCTYINLCDMDTPRHEPPLIILGNAAKHSHTVLESRG